MLNPVCKVGENVQEQCFFNQAFKIHFDESNITIGTNKIHSQILQYTTSLLMNCMWTIIIFIRSLKWLDWTKIINIKSIRQLVYKTLILCMNFVNVNNFVALWWVLTYNFSMID